MQIREATPSDRSETRIFSEDVLLITYALPKGSELLSYTDDKLFYSCDEKETKIDHCYLWIVPANATLPPRYLKYLGSNAKSTTPIHYFEETFEATDHFRHDI